MWNLRYAQRTLLTPPRDNRREGPDRKSCKVAKSERSSEAVR